MPSKDDHSLPSITDKEYRHEIDRIRRNSKRWLDVLGLSSWKIDCQYHRDSAGFSSEKDGDGTYKVETMTVTPQWEYLQAIIRFNILELSDIDDEGVEFRFVHELSHVLVSEMHAPTAPNDEVAEEWHKHEERVCQMLARAFVDVRQVGYDEGVKAIRDHLKHCKKRDHSKCKP